MSRAHSFVFICTLAGAGRLMAAPAVKPAANKQLAQVEANRPPIHFEPNLGQSPAGVRFSARGRGLEMRIGETAGASFLFSTAGAKTSPEVKLRFAGAKNSAAAAAEALEPQPGISRYYTGPDPKRWQPEVPHFARVRQREVYPGIDVVYHRLRDKLEYDFVVQPGADPARIEMVFEGEGAAASIGTGGEVVIRTPAGELRQLRPVAFQEIGTRRVAVEANYRLEAGNRVRVALGEYDRSRTLIVDPVIAYSTYAGDFGGVYFDAALAADGSLIAVGRSNGQLQISRFPGSSGGAPVHVLLGAGPATFHEALGLAIDSTTGAIYVAGDASASGFPGTSSGPAFGGGAADALLVQLDSSLALVRSAYFGGTGDDFGFGVALSFGSPVLVGYTRSPTLPGTAAPAGGLLSDGFVSFLGFDGTTFVPSFTERFNGPGFDAVYTVSASGDYVVVAGETGAGGLPLMALPLSGVGQSTPSGCGLGAFGCDGFYVVYSSNFQQYAGYVGGPGNDSVRRAVVRDLSNGDFEMTLLGATESGTAFLPIVTPGMTGGLKDLFVIRALSSASAPLLATRIGGSGVEVASGLATNGSSICVTGHTNSTSGIPMPGATDPTHNGNEDVLVFEMNASTGAAIFGTYLGGSSDDFGNAVVKSATGDIWVVGYTSSADFPLVAPTDSTLSPSGEAFVTKFIPGTAGGTLVTVTTNPPGLQITVDGVTATAPQTYSWTLGSAHTVNVPSPQPNADPDARYRWGAWSQGGAQSQTVIAPAAPATYTAEFVKQFRVSLTPNVAGRGTVTLSPTSPDGFYDEGTPLITITAAPNPGFQFASWSGCCGFSLQPSPTTIGFLNGRAVGTANFFETPVSPGGAGTIGTIAGRNGIGFSPDNTLGTSAQLNSYGLLPSIVSDTNGNLIFTDNRRIRRLEAATGRIVTIAGTGTGGVAGIWSDGPALARDLPSFSRLCASDMNDNIFVAIDARVLRLGQVSGAWTFTTLAGGNAAGDSGDGGAATSATLTSFPYCTVDRARSLLYISPGFGALSAANGHRVRVVDLRTGIITSYAGTGVDGASGDGGLAAAAQLSFPSHVSVTPNGDLYIETNSGTRRVDFTTKVISTVSPGIFGRVVDAAGSLFGSTSYASVERVTAAGSLTHLAGTGIEGSTGDGGPAAMAQIGAGFSEIGLEPGGGLVLHEQISQSIRRIVGASIVHRMVRTATAPAGVGSVNGANWYVPGTPVTLQAFVPVGMTFSHWSGPGLPVSGPLATANPFTFTPVSDGTFVANFAGAAAAAMATGGASQSAAVSAPFVAALEVTVRDAGNNPVSGVTVTFAAPGSGASATLSATTATTNASGIASVTATANATAGGPYNVTATVASLSVVNFALTNTAGAAATATATAGTPQSAVVSVAFAAPLQVTVKDAGNNPVSGVTVTFAAPSPGASAVLSSTTATTDPAGIASITAMANATAGGPYNVTATVASLSVVNFALTNTAGAAASVTPTAGTPQSMKVNTAFAMPLQVTVKDAGNNPVSGVTVTFAVPGSGASATLSATTATTNAAGIASVTATANATAGGPYNVTATVASLPVVNFALTNTAGAAAAVTPTTGTPQSAVVSTAFAALQVTVKDAGNNPVSGVTVTFAVPASGASVALSSTTATTNASGVASVTATANATAGGPYNVTATAAGVATPANFALTNIAGAATNATATGGATQSAVVSVAFATALQVTVRDAGTNPVAGVTVTFAVPASGASAALSSTTATTNAAGIASVTATANATAGGPYNVTANAAGVATPVNFVLTNTAGAATSATPTAGTPQSAVVSLAFAMPLRVTVRDAGGNPAPNVTVMFAAPSSGARAVLSAGSAVTDNLGNASVTATANTTAGAYNVTANAAGVATPATFALTNTAGAAVAAAPTGGASQSAVVSTAFAAALQVTVRDAGNNPVSGVTVTFAAPGSGASAGLSSTTATTNASGVASVTASANATAGGPYNVTATVASLPVVNFALTNTAAAGSGNSAVFLNLDNATKGNWRTQYGGDGYFIPALTPVDRMLPSYASLTIPAGGGTPYTWGPASPDDARLLEKPTPPGRIFTALISETQVTLSLSFNDGVAHRVAFYMKDGGSANAQDFAILDGSTILNARNEASFGEGRWLVYSIRGSVSIRLRKTDGNYAQLAGVFFGNSASGSVKAEGGSPQLTQVGTPFTTPLSARVVDGMGAPVSGVTVTFAAPPATGASAALSAPTAVTNASGIATVNATANTIAGTYNVTASAVGGAVNFVLTNTPGPAVKLTLTGGSPQSVRIDTPFPMALQLVAQDVHNNPVPGVTVNYTRPISGASATLPATAVTLTNGVASVNARSNLALGSYEVIAMAGSASPARFQLTNTVGLPAGVAPTGGTPQSATVSTVFGLQLQARVTDAGGNPLSGITVQFAATATSGALALMSPDLATTDAGGVARTTASANASQGSYTVRATVTGVTAAAVFNLTNTAGTGGGGGGASATLLAVDDTTRGNWKGKYGSEGHFMPMHSTSLPTWLTMSNTGNLLIWNNNPDERGLERATGTGRIVSSVYSDSAFELRLNVTGGPRRVALYMTDTNTSATQSMQILNAATRAVIDTQNVPAPYSAGRWLVYSIQGNVIVRMTRTGLANYTQINGVFVGP